MAGWDTNKMVAGLPGVMNLAAASGEDLALVSDIVTDALSGFGMEASQSAEFADLLASASSNSNTNVAMMGETFKYVAPIAGALSYTAEDTALAIGLMANAGIKGSQAGTALRNVMTRMAKPTKESAQAMKDLGIELTDSNGEMRPFIDVMGDMRESFSGLTEEQKAQYAAMLAGKQGMSGLLAIINASEEDYEQLTQATREYNGEAERMAKTMEDNLQGQVTALKSALEGLAIDGFKILVPILSDVVSGLQKAVDWFANLDEGQKGLIIRLGLMTAAAGPAMKVVAGLGGAIFGTSEKTGLLGKAMGTAAETTGGFGGGIKGLLGLINPTTAAIALATAGVGAFAWTMSKDAVPAADLFGEGVSENTKKALEGFLELEKEATVTLTNLKVTGNTVTKEMSEEMKETYSDMTSGILEELEGMKEENEQVLTDLFTNSKDMTEEEQAEILKITQQNLDEEIKTVEELKKEATDIYDKAAKEKRTITEEEAKTLEEINKQIKETGIDILSESEAEAAVIRQRMADQAGEISTEMASALIKDSAEVRDKTIEQAEEEYDERIKYAEQLKRDGTKESKEAAEKIIKEAKKQRDETVKHAEKQHEDIVKEAEAQAKEHIEAVDTETGEIKTKWQMFVDRIKGANWDLADDNKKAYEELNKDVSKNTKEAEAEASANFKEANRQGSKWSKQLQENADDAFFETAGSSRINLGKMSKETGKNFKKAHDDAQKGVDGIKAWNNAKPQSKTASFTARIREIFSSTGKRNRNLGGPAPRSGYTWVGEQGRELVKLPPGSRVMSNQKSESMVGIDYDKLGKSVAKAIDEANITVDAYMDSKKVTDSTNHQYNRRLRYT